MTTTSIKMAKHFPAFVAGIALAVILCSCSTPRPNPSGLPPEIKLNPEAGRGDVVRFSLRLPNGHLLPFAMDTGAPWTMFERGELANLGRRVGDGELWNFGTKQPVGIYVAPKLFLGGVPLRMTGSNILCFDRTKLSGPNFPALNILGMDVLGNYCIQLDFAAGKMRFLDDTTADKSGWGHAFPLTDLGDGCPLIDANITGAETAASVVDTGHDGDGWLTPQTYKIWTNYVDPVPEGQARSPDGVLGGQVYKYLHLKPEGQNGVLKGDTHLGFNGLGVRFLARHLVTLDFPQRTLYLKVNTPDALLSKQDEAAGRAMARQVMGVLLRLREHGKLPGWDRNDQPAERTLHFNFVFPLTAIVDNAHKKGETNEYHFKLARATPKDRWKLEKVWETDTAGHTIKEFAVP